MTGTYGPHLKQPEHVALAEYMSDLSEEYMAAGWHDELSVFLWTALWGGERRHSLGSLSDVELTQLRGLHEAAGGWIILKGPVEDDELDLENRYMPTPEDEDTGGGEFWVSTKDWCVMYHRATQMPDGYTIEEQRGRRHRLRLRLPNGQLHPDVSGVFSDRLRRAAWRHSLGLPEPDDKLIGIIGKGTR